MPILGLGPITGGAGGITGGAATSGPATSGGGSGISGPVNIGGLFGSPASGSGTNSFIPIAIVAAVVVLGIVLLRRK